MTKITWTLKTFKLAELTDYYKNPRSLSEKEFKQLKKSLDTFGMIDKPIVNLDAANTIIGGHQRKHVLDASGVKECECWVPDRELTEREVEELNIRLNKNTGAWDFDVLANEFELDDLLEWGFDKGELDLDLWAEDAPEDVAPQIDKAEELRVKWGVESGQLWQLGEHRLICGDCTDKAVVERVMGGERADLVFTSPPYAAQRDYEIGNFDWDLLMNGMSDCAVEFVKDDGAILVNLGLVHKDKRVVRYWDEWLNKMDSTAFPLFDWYVWDKINGLMGDWRGRLAPAHEWIFHFANKPRAVNKTEQTKYAENGITHYKKNKVGLRTKDGNMKGFTQAGQEVSQTKVPDSVIRCQPARGGVEGHPAPFSVDFASALIAPFTNPNEIVFEPFCGSGTTLIACEQMMRIGRGVELEPKYVAVAIQRWVDVTGKEPVLLDT